MLRHGHAEGGDPRPADVMGIRSSALSRGGHTGDDTGNNWLTHGSQVEDEPAEAACTRPSTPAFTLDTADTTAESVLGGSTHPQWV